MKSKTSRHGLKRMTALLLAVVLCIGKMCIRDRIEAGMAGSQLAVGVDRRTKHVFGSQLFSNLTRAAAGSAEGKNATHHSGGLLINNEFALGILILFVAVGCPCSQALPALSLGSLYRPDLPAGVPHEPLVEQVFEGHQDVYKRQWWC